MHIYITYVTCVFLWILWLWTVTPISPGIDGSWIWWWTSTWATQEIPFKSETFTERWWVTWCSTSLPSNWPNTTAVRPSQLFIMLTKAKCSNNSNIVKYYYNLKETVFYLNILKKVIYSSDQSWIFSIITPVFSVTWSFRNHSNMLIWCSFLIINVENICAASYFCGNCDTLPFKSWGKQELNEGIINQSIRLSFSIKSTKNDSRDIYNMTKYFYFK